MDLDFPSIYKNHSLIPFIFLFSFWVFFSSSWKNPMFDQEFKSRFISFWFFCALLLKTFLEVFFFLLKNNIDFSQFIYLWYETRHLALCTVGKGLLLNQVACACEICSATMTLSMYAHLCILDLNNVHWNNERVQKINWKFKDYGHSVLLTIRPMLQRRKGEHLSANLCWLHFSRKHEFSYPLGAFDARTT